MHKPDPCPECGSNNTYWQNIIYGFYGCQDCGIIIDDDYWMKTQPTLVLGEGYPIEIDKRDDYE